MVTWDWTDLAESDLSPGTDLVESAISPWTDLAEFASSPGLTYWSLLGQSLDC